MHMIRRRRKTALLLGAALLLLMEVSRRRLLPTALWSGTEQGIVVRKDGLQADGLVDDIMSSGLRRQALGKNDLSNELTDSKTSRQDSTNNTIDKTIPGRGSNSTIRTQQPQNNSTLHTRLTNGNAKDILNRQVSTDDGLSKIPADGAKNNLAKKESSIHNILPIGIAHDIIVIDDTLSGRVLVNDSRTVEDNLIKREPMKNDLTEGLAGGANGDTLGRQAVANDVLSNNSWESANNGFSKGSNEMTNSKIFNRRAPTDSGLKITSIKGPEHRVSGNVSTRTCRKKTNLVFLKTHKTASSTVQNIIMRFGSARNLTFVLPAEDNNIGWPGLFKRYYVLQERSRRKNITYNILCHHTRFNYSNIRELMPDDTMYITIVRNPADMYESIFYYFGLDKYFRIHSRSPLKKFLGNPYYYVKKNSRPPYQLYRNPMFYDLGYIRTEYVSEQTIKSDIGFLEKIFSVVMVADYFEESLILMKHTLCWDIDDVTFFKMNARREESIRHVTKEMAGKIRSWNKADAMLFDHFNKTLWFKLSQLPFDWRKEVEVLKARNRRLQEECIESDNVRNAEIKDIRFKVFQPDGITIKGFRVKESARMNETCVNMANDQ
ncbi:Galactose-3-O-sulfotransferase [Branchiostoma belcheri]|nr:Galactose-3-O-sulfotransferase [Branchiostoma belcheri]